MIATLQLFEALKTRFGETIESKVQKAFEIKKDTLSTKEDIYLLKEQVTQWEARLDIKIANSHADMIKWMFIFWMGQVAVIAGLLAYFFHINK